MKKILFPFLLVACLPEGIPSETQDTATPETNSSEVSDTDAHLDFSCKSEEDCEEGLYCSIFGVCINEDSCLSTQDCGEGKICEGYACEYDGCAIQQVMVEKQPSNVMIVLDRSSSMLKNVVDGDKTSPIRWDVAVEAVLHLISEFSEAYFGLTTFSACIEGEACTPGNVIVPSSKNGYKNVETFLNAQDLTYVCLGSAETSTGETLDMLANEKSLQDPLRENVVLLITDGEENEECTENTNGPQGAANLLAKGVRTFVIGFSDTALPSLDEVSKAGGTKHPLFANSYEELETALMTIMESFTCTYFLQTFPAPPEEELNIFFNGEGPVTDWHHENATNLIKFTGVACDQIKANEVQTIDIVHQGTMCPIQE